MEISILLSLLLMIISLGELFHQGDKICLIHHKQINTLHYINQGLKKGPISWAVKLFDMGSNLLNTVTTHTIQKDTQTVLVQTQRLKIVG